jgi:hypothetical protein
MRLSEEQIAELTKLKPATELPWAWDSAEGGKCADVQIGIATDSDGKQLAGFIQEDDERIYIQGIAELHDGGEQDNAAYIVAAVNNLPDLLADLAEMRQRCEEAERNFHLARDETSGWADNYHQVQKLASEWQSRASEAERQRDTLQGQVDALVQHYRAKLCSDLSICPECRRDTEFLDNLPAEAKARQEQALREAATELLEVAKLRGDNELPNPADDPKLWSARMQTAWIELDTALAALEAER